MVKSWYTVTVQKPEGGEMTYGTSDKKDANRFASYYRQKNKPRQRKISVTIVKTV